MGSHDHRTRSGQNVLTSNMTKYNFDGRTEITNKPKRQRKGETIREVSTTVSTKERF